ncbi:MAG: helix-turn-helix transcriptional regulator [Proteobacteria bacterium]|nr:helix-turn-helix transcriptional regulator [Pseudomonadota bacterium]
MRKVFSPRKLALARGRARILQTELGKQAGISSRQISRYETGEQEPRLTAIARLADVLNIEPDDLFDDADE